MNKSRIRWMTSSALLAAVTAVCAQIILPLPFTPVFFSLLVLAVLLTGAVLPPRWAAAAQLCYLALGFFGVPVFGGFKGGPGVLLGPTGGYLAACPLMALVVALLIQGKKRTVWRYLAAMCAALVLCYTLGTIWFCLLTGVNVSKALAMCVFPFVLPDLLKGICAALAARALDGARRYR